MKSKVVCFTDREGNVILEKKLTSLPLREEIIIAKSIEFFNDPEPCMIHRSAVMKRLFMEIDSFLNECLHRGERQLLWEYIPEFVKRYIDVPDNIAMISVK